VVIRRGHEGGLMVLNGEFTDRLRELEDVRLMRKVLEGKTIYGAIRGWGLNGIVGVGLHNLSGLSPLAFMDIKVWK